MMKSVKDLILLGDRDPGKVTHRELDAAIQQLPGSIRARWVATGSPQAAHTGRADALWVVSGSPFQDDDAVYEAIKAARISGQPFLGTCAGFQYAVVEFARDVAGIRGAGHAESSDSAEDLVIEKLACSLVGQQRQVTAIDGTRLHELMGSSPFPGFHWCNYGLAPAYAERLVEHGLAISAIAPDAGVEAIELPAHPFFLATLFQPQIGSLAGQALHPVIQAFVAASANLSVQ
jgi:CTP synthase (UTP-ammonia lyase)